MQEKIKIVYSWIGPNGPMWNTEVPNVFSLAAASGPVQLHTHHFTGDSVWLQLFSLKPDLYEIYPACGIMPEEDTKTFIIPYTLLWRIDFTTYFCGRTGLLEFAHAPGHLIKLVRNKNGYILIDHGVEANMSDYQLDAMHGYFQGIHGIPLNKIIYMTGAVNATSMYQAYCDRRRIPHGPENRLTIVPYASGGYIFKHDMTRTEEPGYDTETVPEKLFLAWNRRHRLHRIEIALGMEKLNVVDRSYISFGKEHVEIPTHSFMQAVPEQHLQSNYDITDDIIDRFERKLPLTLDNATEISVMCQDSDNTTKSYYQNSLISIVTETTFREAEVALTEKSFKPFKQKHPFILVAGPEALQFLHSLGFKTFSEFWPEDYDEGGGPEDRMKRIMNVMELISNWTPEQIIDFKRRVKPILEHNYNVLKNLDATSVLADINTIIENNKR